MPPTPLVGTRADPAGNFGMLVRTAPGAEEQSRKTTVSELDCHGTVPLIGPAKMFPGGPPLFGLPTPGGGVYVRSTGAVLVTVSEKSEFPIEVTVNCAFPAESFNVATPLASVATSYPEAPVPAGLDALYVPLRVNR